MTAALLAQSIFIEIFKEGLKESKALAWINTKIKGIYPLNQAVIEYLKSLEDRYSKIRIFCMNKPVEVRNIYVDVIFLNKLSANKYFDIVSLEKSFAADRIGFSADSPEKKIRSIDLLGNSSKVIIYGKPGSGKTTFLKRLLIHCLEGEISGKYLPIFITLKTWSDSKLELIDFIKLEFNICNFPAGVFRIEDLLQSGKCLILLDGFDEMPDIYLYQSISKLEAFISKYSKNAFYITCRIAAREHVFERFTQVEVADFNREQIIDYINNWFNNNVEKADKCLNKIFDDESILEMAKTPLLLTMLCVTFDELMDFPKDRSELYSEAINALLRKWDASRSIKRDEVYKNLPIKRKEDMLSFIAFETFNANKHFIHKKQMENHIKCYIENLPDASESQLDLDSAIILKSIEAQHGILIERAKNIYAFSHLTFQEYYTARYVLNNSLFAQVVADHFPDKRWDEVFLLLCNMLNNADQIFEIMFSKYIELSKTTLIFNKIIPMIKTRVISENVLKTSTIYELNAHLEITKYFLDTNLKKEYRLYFESLEFNLKNLIYIKNGNKSDSYSYYDLAKQFNDAIYSYHFLGKCLNGSIYLNKNKRDYYWNILQNSETSKVISEAKTFTQTTGSL